MTYLRAKLVGGGMNRDPVRIKCHIRDLGIRRDTTAAFGGMIKQEFVEHRTLDLVSRRVLATKDVTKEKASAAGSAGGNDFAAIFHNDIRPIDFLFDSHAFKGAEAARQKGFADFETRKFFFLENRHIPPLFGQQSSSRTTCRAAADDDDVEELRHGKWSFSCQCQWSVASEEIES